MSDYETPKKIKDVRRQKPIRDSKREKKHKAVNRKLGVLAPRDKPKWSQIEKDYLLGSYAEKDVLKLFDMDMMFGPSIGLTRKDRYERCLNLQIDMPAFLESILENNDELSVLERKMPHLRNETYSTASSVTSSNK